MPNTIVLLVLILLIVAAIFVALQNGNSAQKKRLQSKILSDLQSISQRIPQFSDSESRDILIRLDTIFSKSLQLKYSNSESCGENLKKAKDLFDKESYNELWKYHKMRNLVVHDGLEISRDDVQNAYSVFRKSIFKLLG